MDDKYNFTGVWMAKSCEDKLFFMNKISKVKNIVDFGCADGALIREMNKVLPDINYIGYDNNSEMIKIARNKSVDTANINYTNIFPKDICNKNSLLNLSSVIHEIYSYCSTDEVKEFWDNVFLSGFDYVSIRDMCISENVYRLTNITDYWKLINAADKNQIRDFEHNWGSLMRNNNFLHFLMKYKYIENWDREVKENYFPITLEELLKKIPTERYPTSVWLFAKDVQKSALHPTQKPVALIEQLIKTYTNPGELVLDSCAGSCTTAVASINTGRNYICIEKDIDIYNVGKNRVKEHLKEVSNI